MSESTQHLDLVRRIVAYVRSRFSGMQHVVTLHDLPGAIGCDKPPKIGSFRPDVYAVDAPMTCTIIGEAKTTADLETEHTRAQFESFLQYLRAGTKPLFIVAVPWQVSTRARGMLSAIGTRLKIGDDVEIVIIDDIEAGYEH